MWKIYVNVQGTSEFLAESYGLCLNTLTGFFLFRFFLGGICFVAIKQYLIFMLLRRCWLTLHSVEFLMQFSLYWMRGIFVAENQDDSDNLELIQQQKVNLSFSFTLCILRIYFLPKKDIIYNLSCAIFLILQFSSLFFFSLFPISKLLFNSFKNWPVSLLA